MSRSVLIKFLSCMLSEVFQKFGSLLTVYGCMEDLDLKFGPNLDPILSVNQIYISLNQIQIKFAQGLDKIWFRFI